MKRALVPTTCCYCGKVFTPIAAKNPEDEVSFFNRVVDSMEQMIQDGLPLQCDECARKQSSSNGSPVKVYP